MKIPKADKIGGELKRLGYVSLGKRYLQTGNNCFDISCYLADKFGYWHPENKARLGEIISEHKTRKNWGGNPLPTEKLTEACLVIREPDYLNGFSKDVHVAFELLGKEFNYGPGTRDGFPVLTRIYVRKVQDKN